jgi:predicted methyltransferase
VKHFICHVLLGIVVGIFVPGLTTATDWQAILADPARPDADRARDANRKPEQVLEFFGIKPGQKVADLLAGGGYYTRILVGAVGKEGEVYAGNNPFYLGFVQKDWDALFTEPAFKNVHRVDGRVDQLSLPQDGSLDAVIIVLAYHDLLLTDEDRSKMNAQVFAALKPGGVYGIVDHHAKEGSGSEFVKSLHRIDEALIIAEVTAAGFKLAQKGDFLRHADDDRTKGVFDAAMRGKTDRFVLRFEKP